MGKTANAAPRGTQSNRPNASRALLLRKAVEKLGNPAPFGDAIEGSFPAAQFIGPVLPIVAPAAAGAPAVSNKPDAAPAVQYIESNAAGQTLQDQAVAVGEPSGDVRPAATVQPALAATWSGEDEALFKSMTVRRKASGFQRRGKDVSAQMLRVGKVVPNPGTVVATIVALVADRGTVGRGELLDAMAAAIFPHPKAKPQDRGWCQGYVQGAVRDGYLASAADAAAEAQILADTSR